MKLSEVISNYRSAHNLTVEEFAEKCGLSKGYISMIERGINLIEPASTECLF